MKEKFVLAHDVAKFKSGDNTQEEKDIALLRQREFTLDDVLTGATGRLFSRRGMRGAYDIFGFVSGDEGIQTIGLAMVAKYVGETIISQYPEFKDISFPEIDARAMPKKDLDKFIHDWLLQQEKIFGPSRMITAGKVPLQLTLEDISEYALQKNPSLTVLKY